MGASGYFNTSNQYVKFWVDVRVNSQNIAENTSNITVNVYAKRTNTGYTTYGNGSIKLRVEQGSSPVYNNTKSTYIEITSAQKTYHSWTGNIKHAADGKQYVQVFASINIPAVLSSSEQGYQEWLKTIPRTSSFTLSKSSCELGTPFQVNISRASSSFTHAVTYTIGGEKRYIQNWNNSNVSPKYTPPITDAAYMPNSTSMNATIGVETYNGGTNIGRTTKTIKLVCPNNIKPTLSSISTSKVATDDSMFSCYVQGYSKIRASINGASGIYGSSIQKYNIYINDSLYSGSSSIDSVIIQNSGDITVKAEVIDSRGRKSDTKSTTVRVEPYFKPFPTEIIVRRVNDNLIYDTEGKKIHVRAIKKYSELNGENTCELIVKWREVDGSWSIEHVLNDNEDYYFQGLNFSVDKSYEICVLARDKINVVEKIFIIPTGEVTIDFKRGGRGIAIGKVSETDDLFDVNFLSNFRKGIDCQETFRCYKDSIFNGVSTFGGLVKTTNGLYVTSPGVNDALMLRFEREDGTRLAIMDVEADGVGFAMHTYNLDGSWNSGYRFLNDGTLITRFLTTDSTLTCNGNLQVNGKYISVGKNKMKGWAFTSGSNYWFGLSSTDEYVRMYTDDIKVVNGKTYLGSPEGRFIKLFTTQAVDVSSDIRIKTDIEAYNEQHEKFFTLLKPICYKLKEGHSGRKHFGFVAQEVEEAMIECGMDYKDMAFLQKAPLDENGEEIPPNTIENYNTDPRIKDYTYSLAYTELISLNTHMIQKLMNKIDMLTNELDRVREEVNMLKNK